jgi:hypothetical protein
MTPGKVLAGIAARGSVALFFAACAAPVARGGSGVGSGS